MIESKDLVVIGVEDYHLKAAEFFSKKRILFEYPRRGYNYDPAKHHLNLVSGYLGEFAFLEFITQFLKDKYGKLKGLERYTTLANLDFSYQLIVGKTDEGFDFKKGEFEIDIKTYGISFLLLFLFVFKGLSEQTLGTVVTLSVAPGKCKVFLSFSVY